MKDISLIKRTIEILDEFEALYRSESGQPTINYQEYVENAKRAKKADEKILVQPKLFPEFLEEILGFSKVDYVPEKHNKNNMAPDFTPLNLDLHPFIFETKGNDSGTKEFKKEFDKKSKLYIKADKRIQYVVITNMRELVVYNRDENLEEDYSFSFLRLYVCFRNNSLDPKDKNVLSFLRFVKKFHKKELDESEKIEAISNAPPYPSFFGEERGSGALRIRERETLRLTESIRDIVNLLEEDAKNIRGKRYLLRALQNDSDRKEQVAREIFSICESIDSKYPIPEDEKIDKNSLDVLLSSTDRVVKKAIAIYFYRVAYFTMSRLLLIRVWEDANFIEKKDMCLYNGGFDKWFRAFDKKIERVLEYAYNVGKKKYEWLFTEQNNYSWYIPTESTLVDVLYELAKNNLSLVNRDVLGTVYEEYLDKQDKKNKGQYYTPHSIVSLIWDRVGYTSKGYGDDTAFFEYKDNKKIPKLIFDPATGSGSFLVEAIERLRTYAFLEKRKTPLLYILQKTKKVVLNAIYGSEISAFSYYITEINLLIQVTPIIQKIIELKEEEKEFSGKFTLKILHIDSLSLHDPPSSITPQEDSEKYIIPDKDHDILKLEGEKLKIFREIKEKIRFDYVVANPPYIGEDDHKELFRNTLKRYPYWGQYYQGKMDYLYFFVFLGIQKLKENGKLGFITTSYWLTADGASKLRKYVLDRAKIVEIIDFGEIKLFEHAKGQHNILFVLEKCPDDSKRRGNKIKVLKVKKQFGGSSVREKLNKLTGHIKKHIDKNDYSDEYIEVFYSAVKQGELGEGAWYLFYREKEKEILDKIERVGKELIKFCDVNQGIVPNPLKVDEKVLKTLPSKEIEENDIHVGKGVFVLSKEEIKSLALSSQEKEVVKPYFKNSDIKRYYVPSDTKEVLIYTTKETDINKYPKIKSHLTVFQKKLSSRRECEKGVIPWYSLHWPREPDIFESEKIVCPYRSLWNMFAYTKEPFYGGTDMYFITPKKHENNTLFEDETDLSRHDLRYILGILNSSLFRIWVHHKTKPKGKIRELFYTPLTKMPIRPIDFENPKEKEMYEEINENVQKIIDTKKDLSLYEGYFRESVLDIETPEELPEIVKERVISALPENEKRTIWTSPSICPSEVEEDFILKEISGIYSNLSTDEDGFEFMLLLKGKAKQEIKISGEKDMLLLLKDIFEKAYIGKSWRDIEENLLLPKNIEAFNKKYTSILEDVRRRIEKITECQERIDVLVCELYAVDEKEVEEVIKNLF